MSALDPAVRAQASRTAALNGLRDMIAFLDAHPQVPVPTAITIEPYAANDTDGFEQLARIAHHMGVTTRATPNGTQRAVRKFGPVAFAAAYHPVVPR